MLMKDNVSLALLRKFLKTSYHARTLVTISKVLSYGNISRLPFFLDKLRSNKHIEMHMLWE